MSQLRSLLRLAKMPDQQCTSKAHLIARLKEVETRAQAGSGESVESLMKRAGFTTSPKRGRDEGAGGSSAKKAGPPSQRLRRSAAAAPTNYIELSDDDDDDAEDMEEDEEAGATDTVPDVAREPNVRPQPCAGLHPSPLLSHLAL